MISENSTQKIFRFLQLRSTLNDTDPEDLILNGETVLAKELIAAEPNVQMSIAEEFLRKSNISEISESDFARKILLKVRDIGEQR